MRYIVITENQMTGERTTVETKDFESLVFERLFYPGYVAMA